MTIARKVADLLPSRKRETTEADEEEEPDRDPAGLYECESCGTTFISGAMEQCPDCEASVESIPTERDLGMM